MYQRPIQINQAPFVRTVFDKVQNKIQIQVPPAVQMISKEKT